MNQRLLPNGLLFLGLLALPLIVEVATISNGGGLGLDVLLYQPFDFAYVLIAATLFTTLNVVLSKRMKQPVWSGFTFGIVMCVIWFAASFVAVAQLHLSLGGKL